MHVFDLSGIACSRSKRYYGDRAGLRCCWLHGQFNSVIVLREEFKPVT